jgi:excinuclease ABC subunit B
MYADKITKSMQIAIDETQKRRDLQQEHNQKMGIIPKSTTRHISDIKKDLIEEEVVKEEKLSYDLNNLVIDNRNSQKSVHGRKGRALKKQVFSDFETIKALKEQEIENLGILELKEKLQIAIECMDFEMAAAIRDKLDT